MTPSGMPPSFNNFAILKAYNGVYFTNLYIYILNENNI